MTKRSKRTETGGKPIADDPAGYEHGWDVDDQPGFEDREPAVLVSRSLRLSVATYEEIRAIADERGASPSALMRRWIEDGLARVQEEEGRPADPVSLVDRVQTDVARLAQALRQAA